MTTAPTKNLTGKCRPVGDWIAVQLLIEPDGLIIEPHKKAVHFCRGRVLRLGPRAKGVREGHIVWYEDHSAHSGMSWSLNAAWFGGDEGEHALLIRAPIRAAPSSEALDVAHDRTTKDVDRMQKYWGETPEKEIPKEQRNKMWRLKTTLHKIDEDRVNRRKSRRLGGTSDTAIRGGIFAIEDLGISDEMDCFYRDSNPQVPMR